MSYGQNLVHGKGTSPSRVGPYRFCSGGLADSDFLMIGKLEQRSGKLLRIYRSDILETLKNIFVDIQIQWISLSFFNNSEISLLQGGKSVEMFSAKTHTTNKIRRSPLPYLSAVQYPYPNALWNIYLHWFHLRIKLLYL